MKIDHLPLSLLFPPEHDVRETRCPKFIERLKTDIEANGIHTPLQVLSANREGKYQVLDGETRRQVAMMLGIMEVPCIVVADKLEQADILARRFLANDMRAPATQFERASVYIEWMKLTGKNASAAAREFKVSEALISQSVTVKRRLDTDQRALVESGRITFKAAYCAAQVDDPAKRRELIDLLANGKLNLDGVKAEVARVKKSSKKRKDSKLRLPFGIILLLPNGMLERLVELMPKLQKAAKEAVAKKLPPETIPNLLD